MVQVSEFEAYGRRWHVEPPIEIGDKEIVTLGKLAVIAGYFAADTPEPERSLVRDAFATAIDAQILIAQTSSVVNLPLGRITDVLNAKIAQGGGDTKHVFTLDET